jgi:hypothetical protein
MPNIPILTYLTRYWLLLLATALAILLSLWEPGFQRVGALIYLPALTLGAAVASTLCTHLWFRESVDKETHDGTFLAEWRSLPAETRVGLTILLRVGFFIGCCIVAAALAK